MDALRYTLLILHFVGLAAILGPWLDQLRSEARRITTAMVWGARAQIVTGLALAGLAFASDDYEPDHVKIAVKLVVAIAVVGVAEVGAKRERPQLFWLLAGLLTIVNIAVAVIWR
ncbi:hypothetical protein [Demequina sp. NBRC 110053]|uniref:hypothetical protein n=1 Tax=Demequina sp. NBRC 110053 TaxID=1570342 RepID=UPI000A01EA1D|nr:hypothetical protein [Demequina sp. NBRC 110053]